MKWLFHHGEEMGICKLSGLVHTSEPLMQFQAILMGFNQIFTRIFLGIDQCLVLKPSKKMPCFCRDNFANKNINFGLRGGQLTATLNNSGTIDMQL